SSVVEISDRHHLLGEVAATALALDHPQIAATVQQSAIAMLQYALSRTPPQKTGEIRRLRTNLSIALRSNAVIELHLDQIKAEEESDLKAALDELHAEETDLLAHRRLGNAEAVWTSYFARFRKTYDRLILRKVEQGHTLEAFAYAERARAFEPLDLVMHLDFA